MCQEESTNVENLALEPPQIKHSVAHAVFFPVGLIFKIANFDQKLTKTRICSKNLHNWSRDA